MFRNDTRYPNILAMLVDYIGRRDWKYWRPVIKFLIEDGQLDPRDGKRRTRNMDTALSLARSPESRTYMMKIFTEHQANRMRGELAVRQGRLALGEFGPDMPVQKIPRDLQKRITFQAAVKEVCDDITEGDIPPGQLIGLAKVLDVDFDSETSWRDLCAKVHDHIHKMLL
jgi:hypothetical protein